MKILSLLTVLIFAIPLFADENPLFPNEDEITLSKQEENLCRRSGCFTQNVVTQVKIVKLAPESIFIDKKTNDRYIHITVFAKREYEPGQFVETEYSIVQWIGIGSSVDIEKQENVRAFAKALQDISKSDKRINVIVRGSANLMTAEFPLLGFFSNDGKFFFLDRVTAPLLEGL